MAHAVESMFYVGETPWHGLGTKVDESVASSIPLAIKAAGLDWTVQKLPVFTADGQQVPGSFCIQRDTDKKIVGASVGNQYKPFQNIDSFRWFEPFLETGQVKFETGGSLKEGSVVWVLARIADNLQVTYGDEIAKYILLAHSHDGTLKVQGSGTPIRVVCQNTLRQSQKDKRTRFFINARHTKGLSMKLDEARTQLAKANHLFLLQLEQYQFLASKEITPFKQEEYFRKALEIETPMGEKLETKSRNRVERLIELAETGMGATLKGAKGTWWGAFNGLTQYQTWEAGNNQENRLKTLWFSESNALDLALEMASA
jgi:phage/plasmid-like protein (TIGR03299 family)